MEDNKQKPDVDAIQEMLSGLVDGNHIDHSMWEGFEPSTDQFTSVNRTDGLLQQRQNDQSMVVTGVHRELAEQHRNELEMRKTYSKNIFRVFVGVVIAIFIAFFLLIILVASGVIADPWPGFAVVMAVFTETSLLMGVVTKYLFPKNDRNNLIQMLEIVHDDKPLETSKWPPPLIPPQLPPID